MEAGQVEVLLSPCDEALQVRLVDGADGILGLLVSTTCGTWFDVQYPRSRKRSVAGFRVFMRRQLGRPGCNLPSSRTWLGSP